MCVKQISSHFTIKPHKESLFPIIRLFCCVSLVVIIAPIVTYVSRQNQLLFFFFFDLFCFVFRQRRKKCRFFGGISNVISHFRIVNCTTPKSLETTQITARLQRARTTHKKKIDSMEVRSIDLRTCRMRIDRSTYEDYAFNQNISGWNTSHHVSYTPAGETGSKIKNI
jgi:hypothetical protein